MRIQVAAVVGLMAGMGCDEPPCSPRTEQCNDRDDDCDGRVDEDLPRQAYFPDADGDGFGAIGGGMPACRPPPGIPPRRPGLR